MPSFDNKKRLRFVITIGTGSFDEKGDDQIVIEGFRASAVIDNAGWLAMGTLRAEIFGLKQSDMVKMTSYPLDIARQKQNTVIVYAIDGDMEGVVFAGNIVRGWPDYSRMPDVCFRLQAQSAYSAALKTVKPRSFKGTVDVAQVMRQIADSMGCEFENAGVNIKLENVCLVNSDLEQARDLAKMAGIALNIERNILSIWPLGSYRNAVIPLISKDTGMVGYPSFDGTYVSFDCLYTPSLITGGLIKIETDNINAKGQWQVLKMSHSLDCEKPNGTWLSSVKGVSLDYYVRG